MSRPSPSHCPEVGESDIDPVVKAIISDCFALPSLSKIVSGKCSPFWNAYKYIARPICRRFELHWIRFALSRAARNPGIMMLINTATMEIVTSNSIKVKPDWIRSEDRKDRILGRSSQFSRFRSFSDVLESMYNSNQRERNFSLPPMDVLWHGFSIM